MTKKAKWFSLAEAVESYKPAEVATAIERDGIWVVDRFGRKINVYTGNDLAAATEAGVEDLFDGPTATLAFNAANAAGDISYLVASDGTNTYVFHLVDTDGDDTFTEAGDVGTLALTLTGVTDASKFVAANFADFS